MLSAAVQSMQIKRPKLQEITSILIHTASSTLCFFLNEVSLVISWANWYKIITICFSDS